MVRTLRITLALLAIIVISSTLSAQRPAPAGEDLYTVMKQRMEAVGTPQELISTPAFTAMTTAQVTAKPPCGGWFSAHVEQVVPFVLKDDLWIMTRCTDGRLFMSRFPTMVAPPLPPPHVQ